MLPKEDEVMDHVLDAMEPYYEVTLDYFMDEQRTGKYKTLSENPHYREIKALIEAINILRKYMGWETLKLSEEVEGWEEEWQDYHNQ